jgi:diguanylate cyclase (GGDEF)-like protein
MRAASQQTLQTAPLRLRSKADLLLGALPWPLALLLLCAALWAWVLRSNAIEREHLRDKALAIAAAQSRAYASQLDRNLGQIDYILLSMKYHWLKSGGAVDLAEQVRAGLVPEGSEVSISVFDSDGAVVTSTCLDQIGKLRIAGRDYFNAHAASPDPGLRISRPMLSLLKRQVIVLSRRLDAPDGSFAGVIVAAVDPGALISVADETALGADDTVTVRRADGAFFSARKLGAAADGPMFRTDPAFAQPSGAGYRSGDWFRDGQARIVAWRSAARYPVVAIVGLSERALLDAHSSGAGQRVAIAAACSAALLLLAGCGMQRSARRLRQEHHWREVRAAYRLATENAREGFYMLRALHDGNGAVVDFLIEDCNERGAMYRGLPRQALVGSRLSAVLPLLFKEAMLPACRRAMEQGFYEDELYVPEHGERAPQWLHRRLIRSGVGLAVTLRDISDCKAHQQALLQLANTDPVTSLSNRHWLMAHLPAAVEAARQRRGMLALMYADLDDFKNINDTVGHAAGDALLKAAALRLQALMRPGDRIARLGGDEFTIILESVASADEVAAVAGRIGAALSAAFAIDASEKRHALRASIGISMFPRDGNDGDTLLKHADIAMYEAKAQGKGCYCFFEAAMAQRLHAELGREAGLRQAIADGELLLYYQPRVRADSGMLTSMEALVRWRHPARGLIAPDEFIPLAEKTGLIVPLGRQVIELACRQLAQWKRQGLPLVPVSINVSPCQISVGGVSAAVAEALRREGIPAELLEIEITESATVDEGGTAGEEIAALQAMGIRMYVDDFGTGYSCLAQLKQLDMDGLKIDRAFTMQLPGGPDDRALFEAIVSMAHAFRMRVVAEGVETSEQMRALQDLRCDEVQGYFVSRPVPADKAEALLRAGGMTRGFPAAQR